MSEPRFIDEIAGRLAREAADRIVVADDHAALTGAAFAAAVEDAARAFCALGLGAGDRCLLALPNSVALAAGMLAASRCGAWAVPVNPRLTAAEQASIRAHARPRLALARDPAMAGHAAKRIAIGGTELCAGIDGAAPAEPDEADPAHRVAALIYTSGTTGEPKGVMLTHANLLFVAQGSSALRRIGAADRVYCALPMSHVFGLASVFLGSLYAGARLDLAGAFDALRVAGALADDAITVFQGVPTMYQRLLELADRRGAPLAAPRLRYLSTGGAPLDPGLKARVEAMLAVALQNGYGLTETAPTVSTTRIEAPAADDSCGPPLEGVEVRIADPADGRALAAGGVGEIQVRGPGVMRGYYRAPEATRAVIGADGWFRSGDLGRLDGRGHLYVVGRLKELIIRSGFNVYPPEVEAALTQHPDVALAGVVGRKVAGNEEVVAFLEPRPGRTIDVADVAAYAASRLAPYKRPARYVVLTSLPVTGAAKIRKAELARIAAALGDEPPPPGAMA